MDTRYDVFIVWGHGMQYMPHIMTVIRNNFDIRLIHRHKIEDMPKFIDAVYACDSYPLRHLHNKTRYLLSTPKEVALVLVINKNVKEKMVGKGAFRKPQCQFVQGVKGILRGLYNPGDLPEHHIIHGTDYEAQVPYLLKVFGLKKLSYYTRNEGTPFPYHIDQREYKEVEVNIRDLRCSIIGTGKTTVENSPHYKFAMDDQKEYVEYFEEYWGYALKEDHWPDNFHRLMLVPTFDPILIHGNLIYDGLHRAAILLSRGEEKIKAFSI
jgi:hypothetical protein